MKNIDPILFPPKESTFKYLLLSWLEDFKYIFYYVFLLLANMLILILIGITLSFFVAQAVVANDQLIGSHNEVIFIDKQVPAYVELVNGVRPGLEVVLLDAHQDGVAQITQALAAHKNIRAIHIVSHGQPGRLTVGTSQLDAARLATYRAALHQWSSSFSFSSYSPSILLYGCQVGAGKSGGLFLQTLSELTGAHVAASDDITGFSGDWVLEQSTGTIETQLAFEEGVMRGYRGVLLENVPPDLVNTFVLEESTVDNFITLKDLDGISPLFISDLAIDSSGNIYIIDDLDIWKFDRNGEFVDKKTPDFSPFYISVNSSGTNAYLIDIFSGPEPTLQGVELSAVSSLWVQQTLTSPIDISNAIDSIYVIDQANVFKFDAITGSPDLSWTGGTFVFNNPSSLATDNLGNIYVADSVGVHKFENDIWNELLVFPNIKAIAVDGDGFIYVSDGNNIQQFDADGNLVDGVIWTPGGSISSIATFGSGNNKIIYVAADNEIQKFKWLPKPKIAVSESGNSIIHNDTFEMAAIEAGPIVTKTFEIKNEGDPNTVLKVTGIESQSTDIQINIEQLFPFSVQQGSSLSFEIELDPTDKSNFDSQISISYEYELSDPESDFVEIISDNTNEADDIPFIFTVTGIIEPRNPQILVLKDINDESSEIQDTVGKLFFPKTAAKSLVTEDFVIKNIGNVELTLGIEDKLVPEKLEVLITAQGGSTNVLKPDGYVAVGTLRPGEHITVEVGLRTSEANKFTEPGIRVKYRDEIGDTTERYTFDMNSEFAAYFVPEIEVFGDDGKVLSQIFFNDLKENQKATKKVYIKNVGDKTLLITSPIFLEDGEQGFKIDSSGLTSARLDKNDDPISFEVQFSSSNSTSKSYVFTDNIFFMSNDTDGDEIDSNDDGEDFDGGDGIAENIYFIYLQARVKSSTHKVDPIPLPELNVALTGNGEGTVRGVQMINTSTLGEQKGDILIDCDIDPNNQVHNLCQYINEKSENIQIKLTPIPATGSKFIGWKGHKDCRIESLKADETELDIPLVFNKKITCTAYFNLVTGNLTINTEGQGTVTSNIGSILCGRDGNQCTQSFDGDANINLTATSYYGWGFKKWVGDCDETGHVTLKAESQCQAVFAPLPVPTMQLTVDIVGQGKITAQDVDCGTDCQAEYPTNMPVVLTATPGAGLTLEGWGGDCQGNSSTTVVTMDTARQCTAIFNFACPETPVIYVNKNAKGNNTGCSWADALTELSTALRLAEHLSSAKEIWVAKGSYTPTRGDERTATFQLRNGLGLYGGFRGVETERQQRDTAAYPTILSGDIGTPGDPTDNSFHVVTGSGSNATAILDGFMIRGGYADQGEQCPHACGGGLLNENGSPTINYVMIQNNFAVQGGGVFNGSNSNPTLQYSLISHNIATEGAGILNDNSHPVISHIFLTHNTATQNGGGLLNRLSQPLLSYVDCSHNIAAIGGGIANETSNAVISHSTLFTNSATQGGGIANLDNSNALISHVVLGGNIAADSGAAIFNQSSAPVITQTTVNGNTAVHGGGIFNVASRPTVNNTILWENPDTVVLTQIYDDNDSHTTVNHSIVQWGWPGEGNLDKDPLLTTMIKMVTADQSHNSDFHLQPDSPAIDAGDNGDIPQDLADAECSGGDGNMSEIVDIDIDGRPRLIDGDGDGITAVDIGAYEASLEPLPRYQLAVTKTGEGQGTVTANKGQLDCGSECVDRYLSDTRILLTARAAQGSIFAGWQGDCQSDRSRATVIMTTEKTCQAQFEPEEQLEEPDIVIIPDIVTPSPTPTDELPPCPLSGDIDFICNAQGETAKAINLEKTGNVSNVILEGTIENEGILSNATITSGSQVTGGTFTGYVINNGVIKDMEFKGAILVGGTLAGVIKNASQIDGYFEDVYLAPDARISGGKLQGDIIGAPEASALLENLTIAAGSYVDYVIIGRNVEIAPRVTLGEHVQFLEDIIPPETEPSEEEPPIEAEPPTLEEQCATPNATVIGGEAGEESQTCFIGQLQVGDDGRTNHAMLTQEEAKTVRIAATILIDPQDVGKAADILMVMIHQTPASAKDYMRVSEAEWRIWRDKNLDLLKPAQTYAALPEKLEIPIYQGNLSGEPMEFTVFVGYRPKDSATIVYNGQKPIHFYIDRAAETCVVYAVHDDLINDTQFVQIDLSQGLAGTIEALGPAHPGLDIEGLSILPSTPNVVYATSGNTAEVNGEALGGILYFINSNTGELKVVGSTGFDKVAALAIHPESEALWAWARNNGKKGKEAWSGLILIEPDTAESVRIKAFDYEKHNMEAIAWHPNGKTLYTASGSTLWAYDKNSQTLEIACQDIANGKVEGMDIQPNGLLLLGIDKRDRMAIIRVYDPERCEVVNERVYDEVPYDDLESIVWPPNECDNQSWMSRKTTSSQQDE